MHWRRMGTSGRPKISTFWIRPTRENAQKVIAAVVAFGAPLHDLRVDDLSTPGLIFQIGVEPVRIDILTVIDGVEFDAAWRDRMISSFADQPVAVISEKHLIENKLAAARPQDLADVERLRRKRK